MGKMPVMVPIRQTFDDSKIVDVEAEIARRFRQPEVQALFHPGDRVAVGVGSRGLHRLVEITAAVVRELKGCGTAPFIVPAMGSHGGATAEGQVEILAGYGITEAAVGAPIEAGMDVVRLGTMDGEVPVWFDRIASGADAIVAINRIKTHTSLQAETQSGLMKMLAIGLGKHKGAAALHSCGVKGIQRYIPQAARIIMERSPFACGVALVENCNGETHTIEVLPAPEVEETEKRLLRLSKSLMGSLPVERIDVLIVDEIGKDYSGTGMDPTIIGRWKIWGEPEPARPSVTTLVALDLSAASHGNAGGVGLADIIPRRLYDKIDFHATYRNAITATYLQRVQVPLTVETDEEALSVALQVCGQPDLERVRVVRIRNTLALSEVWVSASILQEIRNKEGIVVTGEAEELRFDSGGSLSRTWAKGGSQDTIRR